MFFIDFTSPDGKSHRIDLSEHPITFQCPDCGEEQPVILDGSDPSWCDSCFERHQEEEKNHSNKRFMQKMVTRINKLCDSNIDESTLNLWMTEAAAKNLLSGESQALFMAKIDLLRKAQG